MENGLRIAQLPQESLLLPGHEFVTRFGGGNRRLLGSALQGKLWWPEITHLRISDKTSSTDHYALEEVPTTWVPMTAPRTVARNRQIPLVLCAPWLPANEGGDVEMELQGWRLTIGDVEGSLPNLGIILPADQGGGPGSRYWVRVF